MALFNFEVSISASAILQDFQQDERISRKRFGTIGHVTLQLQALNTETKKLKNGAQLVKRKDFKHGTNDKDNDKQLDM